MPGDEYVRSLRRGEPVGAGHGLRVLLAEHAAAAEPADPGAHPVLQVSPVSCGRQAGAEGIRRVVPREMVVITICKKR